MKGMIERKIGKLETQINEVRFMKDGKSGRLSHVPTAHSEFRSS